MNASEKIKMRDRDFISGRSCSGPAGGKWIQRITNSYALVIILSGSCRVSILKESLPLETGNLLLMTPGVTHYFQTSPGTKLLWFQFMPRPHIMPLLEWPEAIHGASPITLNEQEFAMVRDALEEALSLDMQHLPNWYILAVSLLETVIVRGYNHIAVREREDARITGMIQRLLDSNENIDKIVRKSSMSRSALYMKFKQATGFSPHEYRETTTLRQALRLLETTALSIKEIAEAVGIENPFYFSTRFKKRFGMSPRKYRSQHTANQ